MSKKSKQRPAIGLDNGSVYPVLTNDEQTRIQAVDEITGIKPNVMFEEDLVGDIFAKHNVRTTAASLNVRSEAHSMAPVSFTVPRGTILSAIDSNGEWLHVETTSLPIREGYVMASFTAKA